MKFSLFPSSRRDRFTIICLASSRIIRADFVGRDRPELQQLWEAKAPPGASVAAEVEAAYLLGPANKPAVWILNSNVWSQVLNVPSSKTAGLEGTELANALSFEAEALSGISPFDSAMGSVTVPAAAGDLAYWMTQMTAGELALIDDALTAAGATLMGVIHPGGAPQPMKIGEQSPVTRRVELWNDVAFAIDAAGTGGAAVQPLGASGSRGDWKSEAEQWFATRGGTPEYKVLTYDFSPGLIDPGSTISLADEPVVKAWLTAWAAEFVSGKPRVPVVKPAAKPMSDSRRYSIGIGLTIVTLIFCVIHWFWLQSRSRNLQSELTRAEQPQKRLDAARAKVTSLQAQLASLHQQTEALRQLRNDWRESIRLERRRHAGLLAVLAEHVPAEFTIGSIVEEAGHLTLSGVATRPDLEGFATNFALGTEPLGWRYQPPRRRSLRYRDDGGPWLIDWSLNPVTTPTNTPVAPPPAQGR